MMRGKKKLLFAAWACHNKNYASDQSWRVPLQKIFPDLITFDPQEEMYCFGQDAMNERFLALVRREQPDYIFLWIIYDEFTPETLLNVKKLSPQTKIINFFGDDDLLFTSSSRYYALFCDYGLIFHSAFMPAYKRESIRNVFSFSGVNTNTFYPLGIKKKYNVTFIGTPKRDRVDFIKHLVSHGIVVRIFGAGWEAYPALRNFYGGKLTHEKYVRVLNQSKINLSFSKNYEGAPSYKGRVAEIAACGSFALSEYFSGYEHILADGKEIAMFHDKDELLKKVNYYLHHEKEREAIARCAYQSVVRKFAHEKVLADIFATISRDRTPPKTQLPPLTKKVCSFQCAEVVTWSDAELKAKVRESDYVTFRDDKSVASPYKDVLQVYGLEKSAEKMSCCDYYLASPSLGNVLALYAKQIAKSLSHKEAASLQMPSQLVVRTPFFLKNLKIFKRACALNSVDFINEKNTAFVSLPLLKVQRPCRIPEDFPENACAYKYEDVLRSLVYQKRVFTSPYPYCLVFHSLFHQPYLLRRMSRRFLASLRKR